MAKKTVKKIRKRDKFKSIYRKFRDDIELHEKSISIVGAFAKQYDLKALKKLDGIIKKAQKKSTKLSAADIEVLREFSEMRPKQNFLFTKNTIVSVVSLLDEVFSSVFRDYYSNNPNKLSLENKSISYSELDQINKINDAKSYLLDREIETILINEGIKNRFDILNKEMEVSLPKNNDHLHEVGKLIKIRNLIVHNSCEADQEFVKKYGEKNIKKGDKINIDTEYLINSLALVFYIGGFILQAIQIKQTKRKLRSGEFILNDLIHELVKKDKYSYLKELYNTAKSIGLDDINKKMMIINFCIGLKKQGKSKRHIEEVLSKEDWSVEEPHIALCLCALKDKHDEFYKRLKILIKNGNMGKRELMDWEIFTFYKRRIKFREIVKNIIK